MYNYFVSFWYSKMSGTVVINRFSNGSFSFDKPLETQVQIEELEKKIKKDLYQPHEGPSVISFQLLKEPHTSNL